MRKIRQVLSTDRLLGLDAEPLGRIAPFAEEPPAAVEPDREAAAPARPPAASAPAPPVDPPIAAVLPEDVMSSEEKTAALAVLEREVGEFVQTAWVRDGWRSIVFGEGPVDAELMFIGEGPGADEDAQGRPFVGRAGKLLDKQIAAMGLEREGVYIANIAKTRPPGNRVPTPDECGKWMPYLVRQIEIVRPKVIVTLGASSAKLLLEEPKLAITRQRGRWRSFRGIDLMPTFHPAYLLRQYTPENRRRVWDDLKKVLGKIGRPVPEKKSEARNPKPE